MGQQFLIVEGTRAVTEPYKESCVRRCEPALLEIERTYTVNKQFGLSG